MWRPTPIDLGLVVAATAVAGALVLLDPAAGGPEWLFGSVVFSLAGYVVRSALQAGGRARSQRRRARELVATDPAVAARGAIAEERRRLAIDIAAVLRSTTAAVVSEAEVLDASDPLPGLCRIRQHVQLATSELRRQLGVLRAEAAVDEDPAPVAAGPLVPRRDLALAVALASLAAVEVTAYLLMEGDASWLPWSPVLSAMAAACVVGRTAAPGAAAAACATMIVTGSLLEHPVGGGFWIFGTLGGLVWTIAARSRLRSLDAVGGLLLVAAIWWSRATDDPDNLFFFALLVSVAATGGLVVRIARHGEERSRDRAAARETELREASAQAVSAERAGFARELHDVVSHAVGLIAMQAAAAEVSWPHDPPGVRRSVAVIEATAQATLAELDRLGAAPAAAARGLDDVESLVARIRAAGTPVDLTVLGDLPGGAGPIVYRILQEALTNAVRHAPGATVAVTLTCDSGHVRLTVQDDGAAPGPAAARGYGLVGLRERVELAGGTLTAGPLVPRGFVLRAALPVPEEVVTT